MIAINEVIQIGNMMRETVARYNKKLGLHLPLEFRDTLSFSYNIEIEGLVVNVYWYIQLREKYFNNSQFFGKEENEMLIESWTTHEFGHHLTPHIKEKTRKIASMQRELNECMESGNIDLYIEKEKVFREFHRQVEEEAWEHAENMIEFTSENHKENFFIVKELSLASYESQFNKIKDEFVNSQKENV